MVLERNVSCRIEEFVRPKLEKHLRASRNSSRDVYLSYVGAITIAAGCAAGLGFLGVSEALSRFGALLILTPTALTGAHVYFINKSMNEVSAAKDLLASGTKNCSGCQRLHSGAVNASSRLGEKLNLIIIIETVVASVGTAIWAFGDLL